MAFEPGNTHGTGRPKGSTNKKKVLKVSEILEAAKFSPVDHILKIMDQLDAKDQARVCLQLLQYLEPTIKAVEAPKTTEDAVAKMSDQELEQQLAHAA